jgi:hypothetical protein
LRIAVWLLEFKRLEYNLINCSEFSKDIIKGSSLLPRYYRLSSFSIYSSSIVGRFLVDQAVLFRLFKRVSTRLLYLSTLGYS